MSVLRAYFIPVRPVAQGVWYAPSLRRFVDGREGEVTILPGKVVPLPEADMRAFYAVARRPDGRDLPAADMGAVRRANAAACRRL